MSNLPPPELVAQPSDPVEPGEVSSESRSQLGCQAIRHAQIVVDGGEMSAEIVENYDRRPIMESARALRVEGTNVVRIPSTPGGIPGFRLGDGRKFRAYVNKDLRSMIDPPE